MNPILPADLASQVIWDQEAAQSKFDLAWAKDKAARFKPLALRAPDGAPDGRYRVFGRVSFPNMFKPTKMETSQGYPTWNTTLVLIPGSDLSALTSAVDAAIAEHPKWKAGRPGHWKTPFRAQSEKSYSGYQKGGVFLNVGANSVVKDRKTSVERPGVPPRIVDVRDQPITDHTQIYPGCWGFVIGRVYPFDVPGNCGVRLGFDAFIKVYDDTPLAGRGEVKTDYALQGLGNLSDEVQTEYADLYN